MEENIDEDEENNDAQEHQEDDEESGDFEDTNIDYSSDDENIESEDADEENVVLSDTISEDGNEENEQTDVEAEEDKELDDYGNIEEQEDDEEVNGISNISSNENSECFGNFKAAPGDLPANDQIKGGTQTDEEGCAKLCKFNTKCCSYEHNSSRNICNLNKACRPIEGQKKDFKVCVKSDQN